jgi:hypothetical protein
MSKKRYNTLAVALCAGFLALGSGAARADHDSDLVTPLVTIFAVGALLSYGHSSHHYHHYYRYRSHGHYRGHDYSSHGHYRKHHSSHGHYAMPRRHSSSHGGYHAPRRKH